MIQVTKILEGGVDLVKGTELPRCLVLSNGFREVSIPVSDATIQELVQMTAQTAEILQPLQPEDGEPPEVHTQTFGPGNGAVGPAQAASPVKTVIEAPPPSTDVVEDEFNPGEDYNDTGTGIGSI